MAPMSIEQWPALTDDAWKETYATLHMWTQIVGKVALAHAPPLNHSWAIAFRVTPRGLVTRTLRHGSRLFTVEFDFIDHQLWIRVSDGATRTLALTAQSVADFYQRFMRLLQEMSLPVKIWPMPVEVSTPVRFDQDSVHNVYDPVIANTLWRVFLHIEDAFARTLSRFVGKCSPVHFFWGAFDLAVTRFSGRPAPPRDGPAFMREAYSHEVISHGFWPGGGPILEPAFYSYAVPEPAGLKTAVVQPPEVYYHADLGEFILPYEVVRRAADPARMVQLFVDSTYERAATLGGWDRAALERR
jgi:hypothetical protein